MVAVSDKDGGLYNGQGLAINQLLDTTSNETSPTPIPQIEAKAEQISNKELLELDVDILIPAAVEDVISEDNADKVRARMIIEAANIPITPVAHDILLKRGIPVAPDILANAGGVTVSYLEWVQNRQRYR